MYRASEERGDRASSWKPQTSWTNTWGLHKRGQGRWPKHDNYCTLQPSMLLPKTKYARWLLQLSGWNNFQPAVKASKFWGAGVWDKRDDQWSWSKWRQYWPIKSTKKATQEQHLWIWRWGWLHGQRTGCKPLRSAKLWLIWSLKGKDSNKFVKIELQYDVNESSRKRQVWWRTFSRGSAITIRTIAWFSITKRYSRASRALRRPRPRSYSWDRVFKEAQHLSKTVQASLLM